MDNSPPLRTHLLSIGTARHVFCHGEHGIVFVRDAIALADARTYGLQPVILYVVSVADTPLHWIRFSPPESLLSIRGELEDAWRRCGQLRGPPDVLRVSHHLADSLGVLGQALDGLGIRVEIAPSGDRKFSATLRSVQKSVLHLGWRGETGVPCRTLEQLQRLAEQDLRQLEDLGLWQMGQRTRVEATAAHLALAAKRPVVIAGGKLDWSPGSWMSAWENNLPPARPRSFYKDGVGTVWLVCQDENEPASQAGVQRAEEPQREEGYADECLDDDAVDVDLVPECVKAVLPCWPNGAADFARAAGLTLRKLRWYLGGRLEIGADVRARLMTLAGIEPDEYRGHELVGGCVLVAEHLRPTMHLYDELSHGGDLAYSIEIVPASGPADPSWRYVLIEACGCQMSVLLVPRGGDVANNLDADHFINFGGRCDVPASVYGDVVGACARACLAPERNRAEMLSFLRKKGEVLEAHLPSRW